MCLCYNIYQHYYGQYHIGQIIFPYHNDYEHCLIINLDADENFYTVLNGVKLILKHVHQLQNLYFALTGEELTIKE
jgi:hypothetical protein